MEFDRIVRGGRVVDGSGGPPFRADVGLVGDTIAAVGRLDSSQAGQTLDATGCLVTPGFIDAHVHGDLALLADPDHPAAIRQGVTTYLIGQDGCSFAPGRRATVESIRRYTAGFNGNPPSVATDWDDLPSYLARFDRRVAVNVAYLIPNGNLRIEAVGHDDRPATPDEVRAMRAMVCDGLDAGAVGLSTGLDYIPSNYADAREIAALCGPLVEANGVYVTHMRGYGRKAPVGMAEVEEIARLSGVACHVSHYNGPADLLLPLADGAIGRGVDLTFDTYPYLAGSTILGMVALPGWVQAGGVEATLERLVDPMIRDRLRSDWFAGELPFPHEGMHLAMVAAESWRWAEGLTVAQAAETARMTRGDFVMDVLVASGLAVGVVVFGGDRADADVRAILRHGAQMAGSDGIFVGRFPHPRGFGTFARYLGHHTRDLGDYTWAEAVTHLSGHAARRFRLLDRGLVRPGFKADLAVFDPATIADRSTYAEGRAEAVGMVHVVVNGTPVLADREPTGARPGRALKRG